MLEVKARLWKQVDRWGTNHDNGRLQIPTHTLGGICADGHLPQQLYTCTC